MSLSTALLVVAGMVVVVCLLLPVIILLAFVPGSAREERADNEYWWERHNSFGLMYYKGGEYDVAEGEFRAAIEKAELLGPTDTRLAESLENYAAVLRKTNQANEAEKMEDRARRIRAGQA